MMRTLTAMLTAAVIATSGGSATTTAGSHPHRGVGAMQRNYPEQRDPTPDRWRGPCSGWQYGETLNTPAKFNANPQARFRMIRLITCVFNRWAPGNAGHAVYVAERESGLLPWAVNHGGCGGSGCLGLFQHMGSAWAERARNTLWPGWFRRWPAHWADPRAQAIVSAKMVAAGGWGPWSL